MPVPVQAKHSRVLKRLRPKVRARKITLDAIASSVWETEPLFAVHDLDSFQQMASQTRPSL